MGLWLFLVFVALLIVEIGLFIVVGGAIGVLPTLLLVIAAGAVGLAVIRAQGLAALGRLEQAVSTGGDPVGPMAHGALTVVAGLLLLMPGFLTDALGLALLVPAVRRALVRRGAARVTVRATSYARAHRPGGGSARPVEVIEADYEVVDGGTRPPGGGSGWTRQP